MCCGFDGLWGCGGGEGGEFFGVVVEYAGVGEGGVGEAEDVEVLGVVGEVAPVEVLPDAGEEFGVGSVSAHGLGVLCL